MILGIIAAGLVSERVLRIAHMTPVLINEELLYSQDKRIDPSYIFTKKNFSIHRTDNAFHVVTLGDSYTEKDLWAHDGITSYPELLQQMLSARSPAVEILNYGVGGTGPDQELRYFIDHILPTNPDLVIWQLYANDIEDNIEEPVYDIQNGRLKPIDARTNWMYMRQILYSLAPWKPLMMHSYVFKAVLSAFQVTWFAHVPEVYRNDPTRWATDKLALEVQTMNTLAFAYHFRVFYVLIPPESQYISESQVAAKHISPHAAKYHDMIAGIIKNDPSYIPIDFGVEMVSHGLVPEGDTVSREVLRSVYLGGVDKNEEGDKHLTQLGHQLIADELMQRIQQYLPAAPLDMGNGSFR